MPDVTARINCPLCNWFHDDPRPNPESTDPMALAGVFGSGVFAAHAIADRARKIEEILSAHFKTHTTVEWLRKVTALQADVEALRNDLAACSDDIHEQYKADLQREGDHYRALLAEVETENDALRSDVAALREQVEALRSAQAIGQAAGMFKAFMGKNGVARADVEERMARFDATLGADEPQQSVTDSMDSPQAPLE